MLNNIHAKLIKKVNIITNNFTVGQIPTVYLASLCIAMGVPQTLLSALTMDLEGGGLANGRILQIV